MFKHKNWPVDDATDRINTGLPTTEGITHAYPDEVNAEIGAGEG